MRTPGFDDFAGSEKGTAEGWPRSGEPQGRGEQSWSPSHKPKRPAFCGPFWFYGARGTSQSRAFSDGRGAKPLWIVMM